MPAERPHGLFSRELKRARHTGPVQLSLSVRMPLIKQIEAAPESLQRFLKTMAQVQHGIDAMNALRLAGHPYLERINSLAVHYINVLKSILLMPSQA